MDISLVVTGIGHDRPGIVERRRRSCSRLSQFRRKPDGTLAGKFVGSCTLRPRTPTRWPRARALTVRRPTVVVESSAECWRKCSALSGSVGNDHPGIIRDIESAGAAPREH